MHIKGTGPSLYATYVKLTEKKIHSEKAMERIKDMKKAFYQKGNYFFRKNWDILFGN